MPPHGPARRRARVAVAAVIAAVSAVVVVDVARNHLDTPGAFLAQPALAAPSEVGSEPTAVRLPAVTPSDIVDLPTVLSSTTSASVVPATTTTGQPAVSFPLPVPGPLPLDPYEETPELVVGRITIPAIGLDDNMQSGMTLTAINRGPSHWPGTALPGQLGNVVVAGHRTTYSKPFGDLDRLQPGDRVSFTTAQGVFAYAVTRIDIVEPEALHIANQTPQFTATLFACHPPGSARYRIVAKLALVDGAGNPVPAPPVPSTTLGNTSRPPTVTTPA